MQTPIKKKKPDLNHWVAQIFQVKKTEARFDIERR